MYVLYYFNLERLHCHRYLVRYVVLEHNRKTCLDLHYSSGYCFYAILFEWNMIGIIKLHLCICYFFLHNII